MFDEFDGHVADWLAQRPKTNEQKQYEDAFPVFEKIGEILDERKRLESGRKSEGSLGKEATDRLLSRLDEDVKILYVSLGLRPDGKPQSLPMVAVGTSDCVEPGAGQLAASQPLATTPSPASAVSETAEQPAPAHNTATPAPVVVVGASDGPDTDKVGPLPLTTGHIAFCFAGLRCKTEKDWKDLIGKGRVWLERCLVQPGTRGRGGARKLWNPVFIGATLVRDGYAKPNSVRARFQTVQLLQPWLEAWKTYEADNFDTE